MSNTDSAGSRLAQQEIWRKRLAEAETGYEEAVAGLESAVTRNVDVAAALTRKLAARAEYLRVLRIFSDLVLRGKAPDPEG